jgi:hypothetical protein
MTRGDRIFEKAKEAQRTNTKRDNNMAEQLREYKRAIVAKRIGNRWLRRFALAGGAVLFPFALPAIIPAAKLNEIYNAFEGLGNLADLIDTVESVTDFSVEEITEIATALHIPGLVDEFKSLVADNDFVNEILNAGRDALTGLSSNKLQVIEQQLNVIVNHTA